jgi:branched-chain amino acid transport system ATP-binding protein
LLSLENVTSYYGKFAAVEDISLAVEQGELVAIIGANGAGKTTLLRTICGLHRAKAGRILFEGREINQMSAVDRVRNGIVYCPEGRKLFADMTVAENLEMGAYTCPRDQARNLEEVFSLFPILSERTAQLAGSLSGGEQQMLAVGRTLMGSPRLLLFDEPSTGLAPIIADELMQVIKRLNDGGKTILLVEQNVNYALEIARRGYIIENGRIVLGAAANKLRANEEVKRSYLGG